MVHCFGCISASVAAEQDLWTHHAIFCVTGTRDAIILDRILGEEGNTKGYTSFCNLIFTPENLEVACKWTILMTIGKAPWVHGIAFKQSRFIGPPDEAASNFVQLRHLGTISTYTHHPPSCSALIAAIGVSPSQEKKAFVYEHARVIL